MNRKLEDVDALKQRIEELETNEERFRTICEHAPVMIDSFDEAGNCVLWNRECERMLGYTKADIDASDDALSLFYDDDQRNQVLETISRADGTFREYRVRAKDGTTRVQLWADFRLPNGALISMGHDITERRAIEEQLQQAQKMDALGQLTGGLAHDFNNLLTVIIGNSDLVERELASEQRQAKSSLVELRDAALRGEELIRRLLAFSRAEHRALEPLMITELLTKLTPTFRRLVPETITMRVSTDVVLPAIDADPIAVEQILVNLITNACDAMATKGELRIEARSDRAVDKQRAAEPADYVVLTVEDNGDGIEAGIKQKMFDPFFTTKPAGQGTGLGLAIVYGLVEQHGGFVHVQSTVGHGTRIDVHFPLAGPKPDPKPKSPSSGQTEHVLVVEDQAQIRLVAQRALEGEGYRVTLARDGAEALRILEADDGAIDLVLSDVVMPGLTGPELYERIAPRADSPRFLFMSGYVAGDTRRRSADGLGVRILSKPWTLDALLDAVSLALSE